MTDNPGRPAAAGGRACCQSAGEPRTRCLPHCSRPSRSRWPAAPGTGWRYAGTRTAGGLISTTQGTGHGPGARWPCAATGPRPGPSAAAAANGRS